jgi:hypothetical protein
MHESRVFTEGRMRAVRRACGTGSIFLCCTECGRWHCCQALQLSFVGRRSPQSHRSRLCLGKGCGMPTVHPSAAGEAPWERQLLAWRARDITKRKMAAELRRDGISAGEDCVHAGTWVLLVPWGSTPAHGRWKPDPEVLLTPKPE